MAQSRPLDINILPEKHRSRGLARWMVIAIVVIALLALGLIPAYVFLSRMRHRTTGLEIRLAQLQDVSEQAQAEPARLDEIERQIEQTRAQIERIRGAFGVLDRRQKTKSICVSAPVTASAQGVRITSIVQKDDTCTVTGQAESEKLALSYARAVRSTGRFAAVFVASLDDADSDDPGVKFKITAQMTEQGPR